MTPNRTAQEIRKNSDNHCQKDLTDTECPPLIPRHGRMACPRHTSTH